MPCGGADNGSNVGEEIGAPVGSEAAGDFAIGRGWQGQGGPALHRHGQ